LKPKAPTAGYVDGAWWPRSNDLPSELPALLAVLAVRLGQIQRVSYHLAAWGPAPRRISVDGHLVRLGGFRYQNPHTMDVIGLAGTRVTLLVVPPGTAQEAAHQMLMTAGRRDNVDSVDTLLLSTAPGLESGERAEFAVQRWEIDGGSVRRRA
jgi:hypothetical protein